MYTDRPLLIDAYFNPEAKLPFGLKVGEVKAGINAAYEFFHDLNSFLASRRYGRLEKLLLGNSFAGILSEVLVQNLSGHSATLIRNRLVGGYPDLIPRGRFPDDSILRGTKGIEVKSSKQSGGWQGHNPETGWVMIFRYSIDTSTLPVESRRPTEIVEVMAAKLLLGDWSFSGRTGASRRTITASVNRQGVAKLRANPIYRNPEFAVKGLRS